MRAVNLLLHMGFLPSLVKSFIPSTRSRAFSSRLLAATNEIIPMTLLSGFLGSGKTTTLKHLLENTEGVKLGVIVNDVASVNIDAKLVSSQTDGMIELQNGCACCSLADELLTSVETILSNQDQNHFDAIVIELSGVADPIAIKGNWEYAKKTGHPATQLSDVARVVTLVDACTFGTDWMTADTTVERENWMNPDDAQYMGPRKVTELLAEQVEAADLVLINKADLAGPEQVQIASSLAKGINEKAKVKTTEWGKVSPKQILGDLIQDDEEEEVKEAEAAADQSHDHAHCCDDTNCQRKSHSHSHDHASDCSDPGCTHESHSHDHEGEACSDPDCIDTSHSHSHSHSTSTDQLGITNFVYKRDKPFSTRRLMELLNKWPVPIKDDLDIELLQDAQTEGYNMDDEIKRSVSPFLGVLRSKGFAWLAPQKWLGANSDEFRHDTAMYWSHAGKHLGMSTAGKWWATVPFDKMKDYIPSEKEYNRVVNEDFVTEEWGDRRQEIVFIGTNISEKDISEALDRCLLNEEEMSNYRQQVANIEQIIQNTKSKGLFGADTEYLQ